MDKSPQLILDVNLRKKIRRLSLWSLAQVGKLISQNGVIILSYHSIDSSGSPISILPEIFNWHMDYLKAYGRKGISLHQYLEVLNYDHNNLSKYVALTFDDGFENFHEIVLPILHRTGFRATVFIVHNFLGRRCTWEKMPSIPDLKLMSSSQVIECHREGIEIGSHTLDHPYLSTIDFQDSKRQVADSKEAIENLIDGPVTSFCYPYGDYNTDLVALVCHSGYKAAVTSQCANANMNVNNLELPRLGMNRITPTDYEAQKDYFRVALSGMLPFYDRAKQVTRVFRRNSQMECN